MDQEPQSSDAPAPAAAAPAPMPAAAPAAAAAPRRNNARLLNFALAGAVVLAIAGVAFAAGRLTAPPALASANGFPRGQVFNGTGGAGPGASGAPGIRGGFGAGPTIEGTVESVTDTTLTLKTADGQTIQIALDGTTTYHAQTDASSDDVATGAKVLVRAGLRGAGPGNGASSGNLSATDVTVVP